jgi:protein-tyrosine phosphatase
MFVLKLMWVIEIQRRFQDLEWQQRFRLAHGYNNPQNSPFRVDRSEVVISRNRYGNVQPWEVSRIKLQRPIGGSDYINASPIKLFRRSSPNSKRATSDLNSISPESTGVEDDSAELNYIATQGPKDDQLLHFWSMVMQETVGPVGVIVMLTQTHEGNKEKCSQYFPLDLANPKLILPSHEEDKEPSDVTDPFVAPADLSTPGSDETTQQAASSVQHASDGEKVPDAEDSSPPGSVTLLALRTDSHSRCEVRQLRLEIGSESKEIYHYLFGGWPDFGKPEAEDKHGLLELSKQSAAQAGSSSNPRFVHCSAGVGRTGTFIAMDYLLHEVDDGRLTEDLQHESPEASSPDQTGSKDDSSGNGNGNGNVDNSSGATWGKSGPAKESTPEGMPEDLVFDTVNRLREQRMMMVLNEIQFAFLYEVISEVFVEKDASSVPTVGIMDTKVVVDETDVVTAQAEEDLDSDTRAEHPPTTEDDTAVSEAETEIDEGADRGRRTEADPYRAVAPPGEIREQIEGAETTDGMNES